MWVVVQQFVAPLIKKYWLQAVIFLVLSAGVWYVQNLRNTVSEQRQQLSVIKKQVTEITAQRDQALANYNGLKVALDTQNGAIQSLAGLGDQVKSSIGELRIQLGKDIGTMGTSLGRTLNQNMSNLTCEQAFDFLRNRAIEESKKK